MIEILLAQFIGVVVDGFFSEGFEFVDDFFHAFYSGLMFIVVG